MCLIITPHIQEVPLLETTIVTLDIEKTTFMGNKAWQGGAMFAQIQAHVRIVNCLFEDNTCQQVGGAFTGVGNIILSIHKTNLTGNRALQGGAIDIDTHVHLRATDCIFKDNHGDKGVAICGGFDAVLEINGSYFLENSASGSAGAIFATNNVTLDAQETSFVGNEALNVGGAINIQQQYHLRITNCVCNENLSHSDGGGIYCAYYGTLHLQVTNFTRNRALQGGAISVTNNVYLRAVDCTFYGNYAERIAGAFGVGYNVVSEIYRSYFLKNSATDVGAIVGVGSVTLDVQETSFVGNDAVWVGAIGVQSQVHLRITNCLLDNNTSQQRLGTINALTNVTLEIQGTNFTRNSGVDGGAISVIDHVELMLTNCRLEHNSASDGGGAITAEGNVKLEIRETNFTGNSASGNGGALSISQAECNIARSVFRGNTAKTGAGGAVYIDSISLMKIENTNFTNNSGSDGGANLY